MMFPRCEVVTGRSGTAPPTGQASWPAPQSWSRRAGWCPAAPPSKPDGYIEIEHAGRLLGDSRKRPNLATAAIPAYRRHRRREAPDRRRTAQPCRSRAIQRRGWDSNPRVTLTATAGFQDRARLAQPSRLRGVCAILCATEAQVLVTQELLGEAELQGFLVGRAGDISAFVQ
jgi:hypothetical protein